MVGIKTNYESFAEIRERLNFLEDEYRLLNEQVKSLRKKLAEHLFTREYKKI